MTKAALMFVKMGKRAVTLKFSYTQNVRMAGSVEI